MFKKIAATITALVMLLPINCIALSPLKTFSDIDGHWAFEEILALSGAGIVDGYPDGNFYPQNTITRAEFVKLIYGLVSDRIPMTNEFSDFTDVSTDYWFAPYVFWGVKNGIVNGFPSGDGKFYFSPYENITRQDMSVIIHRLLTHSKVNYQYPVDKAEWNVRIEDGRGLPFWDMHHVSPYAYEAVFSLALLSGSYMNGIIRGYPDDGIYPKNTLTRAEATTVISRVFRKICPLPAKVVVNIGPAPENWLELSHMVESGIPEKLIFKTDTIARDFRYLKIRIVGDEELGYTFVEDYVFCYFNEMSAKYPLVVTWQEQGAMYRRAISFLDENCAIRYYYIEKSEYDEFSLVEFFI
ncbi:MAG: S-layer homology domain-containing protein [Oscillospiraceae bacterium]|nr:S-layer homology domain-containing protein [Oscillospiraceae bacterium]